MDDGARTGEGDDGTVALAPCAAPCWRASAETLAALAHLAPPVGPSPWLKGRVLASVAARRPAR